MLDFKVQIKSTPFTGYKLYQSINPYQYRLTLLISLRNLSVISVFLGFINWPIIESMSWPPCGLAFAESKSCNVTSYNVKQSTYFGYWSIHLSQCYYLRTASFLPTCITSFRLWTSPLGSGTYSSASKSNSVANASLRPMRFDAPLLASM